MAKRKVFSIGSSLSDGLEQTIAAAHNYSSDLRIDVIPLKKIQPDPDNPRILNITLTDLLSEVSPDDPLFAVKMAEMESLQSLANSIIEQGVINPILVYEHQGSYRLIAGERRTLASALAKKTDIQAKIIDGKPNELKIRLLQWIENIERSDLSLIERIENLDKIIRAYSDQRGISPQQVKITEISQLIGCVKSHAMNLKAVLNSDDELKSYIAANKIKNLEKAALIANIESPALRRQAINKCVAGATLKDLKQMVEMARESDITGHSLSKENATSDLFLLGATRNQQVARSIFDSLISSYQHLNLSFDYNKVDFSNPKDFSRSFNLLIKKLEQIHG